MKTILCPTDFSECASNAIHYAHQLATLEKAKVILFHACRTHVIPDSNPYFGTNFDQLNCNISEEDLGEIWKELTRNKKTLEVPYKGIVKNGYLMEEIGNVVKEEQVDLVVMGTEGAHGLSKILFGTITADVIERVGCPVLVVPAGTSYSPIREIVFATDLEDGSESELIYTVEFAKLSGAHISMLHVNDHIFEEEIRLMAKMESIMAGSNYNKISLTIGKNPDTKEGIFSFAERVNADFIVMSAHSRSFLGKIFSKSMTGKIASGTHIPLLALHKEAELVD